MKSLTRRDLLKTTKVAQTCSVGLRLLPVFQVVTSHYTEYAGGRIYEIMPTIKTRRSCPVDG
jgi:hypothetical protein